MFSLLVVALPMLLTLTQATPYCKGTASYTLTVFNYLTSETFNNSIPPAGLVFSPLTVASHSDRVSLAVASAFASEPLRMVAERGDNSDLVELALELQSAGLVRDAVAAEGPTMPGNYTKLKFVADCNNTVMSFVSMIAPSPDWIVFVNSLPLYSEEAGGYIGYKWGDLVAYDAGTDSGLGFTDPSDLSLDVPTVPQLNIAPLSTHDVDTFNCMPVGRFILQKMA